MTAHLDPDHEEEGGPGVAGLLEVEHALGGAGLAALPLATPPPAGLASAGLATAGPGALHHSARLEVCGPVLRLEVALVVAGGEGGGGEALAVARQQRPEGVVALLPGGMAGPGRELPQGRLAARRVCGRRTGGEGLVRVGAGDRQIMDEWMNGWMGTDQAVSTMSASGALAMLMHWVAMSSMMAATRWQQRAHVRRPPLQSQCESMSCSSPGPCIRGLWLGSRWWETRRVTVCQLPWVPGLFQVGGTCILMRWAPPTGHGPNTLGS